MELIKAAWTIYQFLSNLKIPGVGPENINLIKVITDGLRTYSYADNNDDEADDDEPAVCFVDQENKLSE